MNSLKKYALSAFLLLALSPGMAFSESHSPSLDDVINFSKNDHGINESKIQAIREAGLRSGAQAGMLNRAKELVAKISARSTDLDRAFSFQAIIDKDGFLPPVVVSTSQKVETINNAQRIEFAGMTYKIIRPARFVRVAPTWRDYVFAGIGDDRLVVDAMPEAIKPKTSEEKAAWESSVREGWAAGVQQADDIFAENMAVLKREYLGMMKYISLRDKGMVKRPIVAKTPDATHVTNDEISIGVGASEIQQGAVMEKDIGAWGN